jgi:hypothetical protein
MIENRELSLVSKKDVSDAVVGMQTDFQAALKLCKEISGLSDKQICAELDIDQAQWSRIWTGTGHFPPIKIKKFMDVCGNIIPLRWLAMDCGFELKPMKSTLELQLEAKDREIEAERKKTEILRIEMDAIKNFLKEVKVA